MDPETAVTSSPADCPGKGQPRDTIDGGSMVFYINHDRGRATRPNVSAKDNPSPARTRFHVRRKTNGTRGALFSWNPPSTRYAKQDWEEKIRSSFSVKEKLFPARTKLHVRRKTTVTTNTVFLDPPCHALCQARLGSESPAKFFPSRENSSQHAQNFTCAAELP